MHSAQITSVELTTPMKEHGRSHALLIDTALWVLSDSAPYFTCLCHSSHSTAKHSPGQGVNMTHSAAVVRCVFFAIAQHDSVTGPSPPTGSGVMNPSQKHAHRGAGPEEAVVSVKVKPTQSVKRAFVIQTSTYMPAAGVRGCEMTWKEEP